MTGILDAGAAAELILGREKRAKIAGILRLYTWIAAPRIYLYELSELLRIYNRWLELSPAELGGIVETAAGLIDEFLDDIELIPDALTFADECGTSLSGGFYCAAAKIRSGVLISLDSKLRSAARTIGITTAESLG